MNKYPEHEKLAKVADKSHAIGEFLEWLQQDRGISFCKYDERKDRNLFVGLNIQQELAEYFGIDLKELEKEKRQILTEFKQEVQP